MTGYLDEQFLYRAPAPPTPAPTPAPTPHPHVRGLKKAFGWKISKGKCTIETYGGVPCAVSPNYPNIYTNEESCTVTMSKTTKAFKVEDFVTEKYFDVLTVGGVDIDGAPTARD